MTEVGKHRRKQKRRYGKKQETQDKMVVVVGKKWSARSTDKNRGKSKEGHDNGKPTSEWKRDGKRRRDHNINPRRR